MIPGADLHVQRIASVADALGDLRDKVVFVGGAVVGLLITDQGSGQVRPTDDVDIVIEVHSRVGYYRFEELLRQLGFVQSSEEGAPILPVAVTEPCSRRRDAN